MGEFMKLSIIISAYNVEKYIENALRSLKDQTEKQFEVIVVNDGSTDNTNSVVSRFILENKLDHFRLINKSNGGVSSARNAGLTEACGSYVIFLDGDDYVSNDLVENIYNILDEQIDIICWGFNVVTEMKECLSSYFDKNDLISESMNGVSALEKIIVNKCMGVWTGSVAYRKDLLINNNLLFTEGCVNGEDQEFILKALFSSNKIVFINKVLSYYLRRSGSITNSYSIERFDVIAALSRTSDYFKKNSIKDNRLREILNIIETEKIIENFLYNFDSCIRFLLLNRKIPVRKAIRLIRNDIEKYYPGMIDSVILLMKGYKGKNKGLLRRINAYLYFSLLYYRLIKIKNKFHW
jgi:glycosyltransferase involved in cell wall biosynthesis